MNPQLAGLIGWYENETKATEKMIRAIPDNILTKKIHPKFKNAGELAMHISDAIRDLAPTLKTGKMSFSKSVVPGKTTEIADHYLTSVKEFFTVAKNLSDNDLAKKYPFELDGKVVWEPTGHELIAGYICHEIHHRAQLGVILRVLDAKVPGIYGPSADEM
jgi:uncharacterized damage-inducible protein DinB